MEISAYIMRIEIIIFIIVALVVYHIYSEGKWLHLALQYKKYYKMAGVVLIGLVVYWLFKKDPIRAQQLVISSNEYVKYLPLDPTTSSVITPVLDFTRKWAGKSIINPTALNNAREATVGARMATSGGRTGNGTSNGTGNGTIKRSVSETKKKYVASQQDWTCKKCKEKLKATFEVDHIIPLYKGGNNHIDNLQALCAECHRMITLEDRLSV